MRVRDRVTLAHQLTNGETHQHESPYTVSRVVRTLEVSRASFYRKSVLEQKDKQLSVEIERIHNEDDDTLGHKKLAPILKTGKNRVLRVNEKIRDQTQKTHQAVPLSGEIGRDL